jgi:hypothetical protein
MNTRRANSVFVSVTRGVVSIPALSMRIMCLIARGMDA